MYLDTEERRRFAQKGHEYLIEQVQHTGTDALEASGTKQVRLSYNHPVKELVWCVTDGVSTGIELVEPWYQEHHALNKVCSGRMRLLTSHATSQSRCPIVYPGATTTGGTEAYNEENVGALKTASWSSTAKTDSRSNPVSTLTKCNHLPTTPVRHTRVSTRTPSRSSQKNINQLVRVTSPESTTRKCRLLASALVNVRLSPSKCSRSTTTFSVCNPVWVASPSPTKRVLNVY